MRANNTTDKKDKRVIAQAEFQKLIENACVAGFHGSASVTITVQDGHIQIYARGGGEDGAVGKDKKKTSF